MLGQKKYGPNENGKNTYLSTTQSKKQTKQTRTESIMDTESILMVAKWEEDVGEMGDKMRGLKCTNR